MTELAEQETRIKNDKIKKLEGDIEHLRMAEAKAAKDQMKAVESE